jgi:nucleotide-binding universal stress UspA family protein
MNPIRSIVVHVDGTPRCAVRLRVARELALALDARLTALFGTTPPLVDTPYAYAAGAVSVGLLQDLYTQWRARALAAVDVANIAPPGDIAWAELASVPVVNACADQALYADLLVLGQHDPTNASDEQVPGDFVESVLIASGRAALVVPYSGACASVGDTVLVAWKRSPESARAVAAALPMLRRARQVHVASWDGGGPARCDGDRLDIQRYLALHGVNATIHASRDEPRRVGEALLSLASNVNADLLVMGCYGHSRAREFVLGGVTRTVLQSMTVPVLMSH